jgi:hypothetical protein
MRHGTEQFTRRMPARQSQISGKITQGRQDKGALMQARMRNDQFRMDIFYLAEHQQIKINNPGSVPASGIALAPQLLLNGLQISQQGNGGNPRRTDKPGNLVDKPGLIRIALGFCQVHW